MYTENFDLLLSEIEDEQKIDMIWNTYCRKMYYWERERELETATQGDWEIDEAWKKYCREMYHERQHIDFDIAQSDWEIDELWEIYRQEMSTEENPLELDLEMLTHGV